jgi:ribosomal protein L44E
VPAPCARDPYRLLRALDRAHTASRRVYDDIVTKKILSARAERRAAARAADKLVRGKERLARLEEGGTPERPIEVESASQVEPHALAMRCLRCEGDNRLLEHAAETIGGERLRVVRMECPRCGTKRSVWMRIAPRLPS